MEDRHHHLKERLRKFDRAEARHTPPVFVGRGAVIEDIEQAAGTTLDIWREGGRFPGPTRLVQGAPGAGKSSLLAHLEARWNMLRRAGHTAPLAINIGLMDLRDPRRLRVVLDERLPKSLDERIAPAVAAALVSLVAPGTGLSAAAEEGMRDLYGRRGLAHPVVLMVDEAQNTRPGGGDAAALCHLHEGHFDRVPVLPVLAGLGYLRDHLGQSGIGLSRFSNESRCIHTLGRLAADECWTLFEGWLRHFGVTASGTDLARWSDALDRDAQGWPMHTNGFLSALAVELARAENPTLLASVDLDRVRRVAANSRATYYDQRYWGLVLDHDQWVGRAMAALAAASPLRSGDAIRIIGETGPADEQAAKTLRDALVEHGFLQRQGVGSALACPIPSLARHAAVTAMQDPALHIAATLGKINDLEQLVDAGADLSSRDTLGRTPLHIAAECRWADVAAALVEAGADPDTPDGSGNTPRGEWPTFEWLPMGVGNGHGISGGPG